MRPKSIRSLFLGMLLMSGSVFAQSLQLQTTTTSTDINSNFGATVTVGGIQAGDISIAGIDNFNILSQSRSQSIQIINGRQSGQVQLNLTLQPKETGTFALGPATVETDQGPVESESVIIEVSGESLFGSSTTLDRQSESPSSSSSGSSYNWIVRVFAAMLGGLLIRTFQKARDKTMGVTDTGLEMPDGTERAPEMGVGFEGVMQELIDLARKQTNTQGHSLSIAQLRVLIQDGQLQQLLRRIEERTYAGATDPLLEDDCTQYLEKQ